MSDLRWWHRRCLPQNKLRLLCRSQVGAAYFFVKQALLLNEKGEIVVKNIDVIGTTADIPDSIVDSEGKTHKVTILTTKALNGEKKVKTLNVGKNVEKFEKNALKGLSVNKIELSSVPKFEKNSLDTKGKLTIVVHNKSQAKAVTKQLKKAGAPNAKVKVEKRRNNIC